MQKPKLKPYEFRISVQVLGSTHKRAWYSLLKIMNKAGFAPKPKNLDKLSKLLSTKKGDTHEVKI